MTREELFNLCNSGCSAKELTYLGWYCRGRFHTKCEADKCMLVDFAVKVEEINGDKNNS